MNPTHSENYELIELNAFGDERGKLISLESLKNVPFEIKRVYYIFDTLPEQDRGMHAHKELEQLIIVIDGSCEFILDDGKTREKVFLNRPDRALYIGKNMWREMKNFSYGCKLMVLASTYYDENEYIRNYEDFLKLKKDITSKDFKIVSYNEKFLNFSWKWLKDKEIKELTATPDFTKAQQQVWYNSLPEKKDYFIWGIEYDNKPIGAFGIKNIKDNIGEYWGYIGEKQYWGVGIGKMIMNAAIDKAKELNLKQLVLKVLDTNKRAIKSYQNVNFHIYQKDKSFLLMKKDI